MSTRSTSNSSRTSKPPSLHRSISPTTKHALPSSNKLPSHKSSALSSPNGSDSSPRIVNIMSSTITTQQQTGINGSVEVTGNNEHAEADLADNGSSSLSEVEDVTDEEDATIQSDRPTRVPESDVDSEAETEHLEKTPRKPSIIQLSGAVIDRSPSKLSTVLTREELDKLADPDDDVVSPSLNETDQLSATNSKGGLGKRKRSSPDNGESSDLVEDEPSPKRNHNGDDELQLTLLGSHNDAIEEDVDSDANEDKIIEAEPMDGINGTIEQTEAATVAVIPEDERESPKNRFGRRGRRKGRKDVLALEETPAEHSDTPLQDTEDAAAEVDEDEEQAREEELARRKYASEGLTAVEKEFLSFRERHLQEQLDQLEKEMDLLREPDCQHPDFLARLVCLDDRRNDKIQYENTLLKYNLMALVNRTIAERGAALSQYYQDIRRVRDEAIETCYKELYSLQKDRRRFGADESTILSFSASRPEQVRKQAAYGLEVSILSGLSKHIGFPAAPEMSPLSADELQRDLEAMGITRQPASSAIRAQSFQDRTQAGDQFLEQTPWANPQHPAHANGPINNFHTQGIPMKFATPVPQRQFPMGTAINNSGSTIEAMSNPPSSAPGPTHMQHHLPMDAPTPIPNVRNQKEGMMPASQESRIESSPPSHPSRIQQSSYPSPASRIGSVGTGAPIGMAISAFGGT